MTHGAHTTPGQAPLVVQVGFAGSRRLYDGKLHPDIEATAFHAAVEKRLRAELAGLRQRLGLSGRHFFCGISQLAIGADTCFARACAAEGICHRLFLPQPRDGYLAGADQRGRPDFPTAQRAVATELFAHPNIIQERVVSDAATRMERFDDTNLEIVRVSDVIICLFRKDAAAPIGGTRDMMKRALHRKRPVLELRVDVGADGQPEIEGEWHEKQPFHAPDLPPELAGLRLAGDPESPGCRQLVSIGQAAGTLSSRHQAFFTWAALLIVAAHVLATACAVVAVALHPPGVTGWIVAEVLLLAAGAAIHRILQTSRAARVWSMSRLVAQAAASLQSLAGVPAYPEYLFALPLPDSLRALRRTLCLCHLTATRRLDRAGWCKRRDEYVANRVEGPHGQLAYYQLRHAEARRLMYRAHLVFYSATAIAIIAATGKLLTALQVLHWSAPLHLVLPSGLAVLAILLPVVAVATLSLAAAFDLEAKAHTFAEQAVYLTRRLGQLQEASTDREFQALALDVESHLLGETATWYARHAYMGVP